MKVIVLGWSDIFNDYVETELPLDIIKDNTYALFPLVDMEKIISEEDRNKPLKYYIKIDKRE